MKKCITLIIVLTALTSIAIAANPQVTLHITGGVTGDIVLELYADQAPITVANFITYVQDNHFDGIIFHRVIENFMIQAGTFTPDFIEKPTSDPIANESANMLSNLRGTIAMARSSHPDSASSGFFINHVDNPNLDRALVYDGNNAAYERIGYCVFGEVVAGMDIVDLIAAVETQDGVVVGGQTFNNVPNQDVIIQSAQITLDAPVCSEKLDGDIDQDCNIDLADFAILSQNWLECNSITSCQ